MSFDFMRAHGVATDKQAIMTRITTGALKIPAVKDKDWIKLTPPAENEQILTGVYAIHPGSNFIAIRAKGAYTVDWGDGVIQNFSSGQVAEHVYDFDTFVQSTGGLTAEGYKQAKIVIVATEGGSITSLDLHRRHSYYAASYESGIAELYIALPQLATLTIGRSRRADGHEGSEGYSIIAAVESGPNVYFGIRFSAGRYYMTIYTGNSIMERLSPDSAGFLPGERVTLSWFINGGYGSSYFKGANMNNASMGTIHTNLASSSGLRIGGSPLYPANHRFKGKIHGLRITGPNGVNLRNLAGSNPAFL